MNTQPTRAGSLNYTGDTGDRFCKSNSGQYIRHAGRIRTGSTI